MKKTTLILGLCTGGLIAVVGAGAAYAHGHRGGPGFMQMMVEHKIAEAEDFVAATPEQRKVIDAARTAIEAKMKAHFEAHRAARQAQAGNAQKPPADPHDMIRLLAADKIDEAAITLRSTRAPRR